MAASYDKRSAEPFNRLHFLKQFGPDHSSSFFFSSFFLGASSSSSSSSSLGISGALYCTEYSTKLSLPSLSLSSSSTRPLPSESARALSVAGTPLPITPSGP